jgi:hypothetical protein
MLMILFDALRCAQRFLYAPRLRVSRPPASSVCSSRAACSALLCSALPVLSAQHHRQLLDAPTPPYTICIDLPPLPPSFPPSCQ